jgi:multidrug efflux pump subunit AcrA (membrane-fusion protein)
MKRIFITAGVLLAIIALIVFNRMTSKNKVVNSYTEVKKGLFEISVTNSGELIAERSTDIKGPEIGQSNNNQGGGNQGGGNRGGGGGNMGGGNMRAMDLKIQDMVPEGTLVKAGEYIAQLDRSSYNNTFKDESETLKTQLSDMEMKLLDTAVVLTNARDDIKNQKYVVEESQITLDQSKFEPPATIRKAVVVLDEAKRTLEQKKRSYSLSKEQSLAEVNHLKIHLNRQIRLVDDLQTFLAKFTITAPTSGMVIYKKERNGAKRKVGSSVNAFDLVIATLPDLTSMISKIYVNEIEISKVKIGQNVIIKIDAFPAKAYSGKVMFIANIGEQLPNSDSKMFEVQIKVDGSDPDLRPSMTTGNKIIIKAYNDAIFVPTECIQTGMDSIPFVYEKNKTKQIVVLGEANEKFSIVEQGLQPGTSIYMIQPEEPGTFKLKGEALIPIIKGQKH